MHSNSTRLAKLSLMHTNEAATCLYIVPGGHGRVVVRAWQRGILLIAGSIGSWPMLYISMVLSARGRGRVVVRVWQQGKFHTINSRQCR